MVTRFLTCLLVSVTLLSGTDWRPLRPEEMSLKSPKLDPGADAEILLWEVSVEDEVTSQSYQVNYGHYRRVKLFTPKAVDEFKELKIGYHNRQTVSDVAGRVVLPDGKIVPVEGKDIRRDQVVKGRARGFKQAVFAFPGLVPGAIVEYSTGS